MFATRITCMVAKRLYNKHCVDMPTFAIASTADTVLDHNMMSTYDIDMTSVTGEFYSIASSVACYEVQ